VFRSPAAIFAPESIAFIGASERPGMANWTLAIFESLVAAGVDIPLYPVNPRAAQMWGRECYASIAEIPGAVDLALVVVPAPAAIAALRACAARGVRAAIVYSAGFGEGGDAEGHARGGELRAIAAGGLRVCGPNCMGSVTAQGGLLLYPSNPPSRLRGLPAGTTGAIFQSGGTLQFWLQDAAVRGLGFSYAVSSGSELDLDIADYINFMVDDDRTAVICCMIEGIQRPAAFIEAARRAHARRKPIVTVKIGRSAAAQESARSHTGILAGDDSVFDAVCERYGIIRCASLDDLTDAALVLTAQRLAAGPRVAMVTYSGGAKGLFLDDAAAAGVPLATFAEATCAALAPLIDPGLGVTNPLDAGASVPYDPQRFAAICAAITADPGVDVLAVQGQLPSLSDDRQNPATFAAIGAATAKPVVAFSRTSQNVGDAARAFQHAAGIPFVLGIPQAARALRALTTYSAAIANGPPAALDAIASVPESGVDITPALAGYGVHAPAQREVRSADDVADAAEAIGFPVALKALAPQIVHKTEFGAVRLNLNDRAEVTRAAGELERTIGAQGIALGGFLVQAMVSGLELVAGMRDDAQYGPIAVLGAGGVLVEVLRDVAIRPLPITPADVHAMIGSLRCAPLFGAFRGAGARDIDALADAVVGLARFYLERRAWLEDLEINPLVVRERGRGAIAVDIRPLRREPARLGS
jgi:acyl-CoA synthetase (NDP forming)